MEPVSVDFPTEVRAPGATAWQPAPLLLFHIDGGHWTTVDSRTRAHACRDPVPPDGCRVPAAPIRRFMFFSGKYLF